METTIVGVADVTSINHGNSLDFACKENRTLSASKDPDGDGLFNVICYNGALERQYLWPESNEVHSTHNIRTKYQVYSQVFNKRACSFIVFGVITYPLCLHFFM